MSHHFHQADTLSLGIGARPVFQESVMPIELSMVEQRYLAVRDVLDTGATITQVATQYGVDRRTLQRWLTRCAHGGLEALADRSSGPDIGPTQMDPRIEARVQCSRSRQHTGWGPRTLRTKLVNQFGERAPSRPADESFSAALW